VQAKLCLKELIDGGVSPPALVEEALAQAVQRSARECDAMVLLFDAALSDELIGDPSIAVGVASIMFNLEEIALDAPHASKYCATIVGAISASGHLDPKDPLLGDGWETLREGHALEKFVRTAVGIVTDKVHPALIQRHICTTHGARDALGRVTTGAERRRGSRGRGQAGR